MAINQVQMQPGLSLIEIMQHYGTQTQCEQARATSRWPAGFAFVGGIRRSSAVVAHTGSASAVAIKRP